MLLYTIILAGIVLLAVRESNYGAARRIWVLALYTIVVAFNLLYSLDRVPPWGSWAAKLLLPVIVVDETISWFTDKSTEPEPPLLTAFTLFMKASPTQRAGGRRSGD